MRDMRRLLTSALALGVLTLSGALCAAEKPATADPAKDFADIEKLAAAGKHNEAAQKLENFVRGNLQWARLKEAELLYAIELVESGGLAPGKEQLERYIEQHAAEPETARARFELGRAQEGLGLFEDAVLTYEFFQRQHPQHPQAPDALLAAVTLSGKVLGKHKRACEICDRFFQTYPNHPLAPALANQLGRLAELTPAPVEVPFLQDWQVIGPFPSPENSGFLKEFPPEKGVDLSAKYNLSEVQQAIWKPVPPEAKGETGMVSLLPLFAPSEYVVAYAWTTMMSGADRDAALLLGTDDALAVWVNGQKVYAKEVYRPTVADEDFVPIRLVKGKNEILLKITQAKGEWSFCCRLVEASAGGPAAAVWHYQQYAQKFPQDTGNCRIIGSAAGAANAIWYAASIPMQLFRDPGSSALLYEAYEKLPNARKGEGYIAAARLYAGASYAGEAGPSFQRALQVRPDSELWRFEYTRWLKGKVTENAEANARELARVAREARDPSVVNSSLTELTPEQLVALVKENPADFTILKHCLTRMKDDARDEARKLLPTAEAPKGIDWRERICRQWFELTGQWQDCLAWRDAAAAEGMAPEAAAAALKLAQVLKAQPAAAGEPARPEPFAVLQQAVRSWSAYPDFPRDEFAAALAGAAADASAKKQALELIAELKLNSGAAGAEVFAALRAELTPEQAADAALAACVTAVRENKPEIFRRALDRLQKLPGPPGPQLAEAAFEVGSRGPEFWKDVQQELVAPLVARLEGQLKAVNPPTAASRLALARLGRFQAPPQSIARHDEFLQNHADDPNASWVRRNRFYELQRAGGDELAKALKPALLDLPKNPALATTIPPEIAPKDIEGYEVYVKTLSDLKATNADAALCLARAQLARWDAAGCFQSLREIVQKHAAHPAALEARRLGVRIFEGGRFPTGLGQGDAETAFAWLMDLTLSGEERSFTRLTGNVWRLACHPMFRYSIVRPVEPDVVELSRAAQHRGAAGLEQWNAYVARFPLDRRGAMMRLQTLVWLKPAEARAEVEKQQNLFPQNLQYRALRAECLWRLGQTPEALNELKALASARELDRWNWGLNDLWRRVVFGDRPPPSWAQEYEMRVRATGDWPRWLALETDRDALNGPLSARLGAVAAIQRMDEQMLALQQNVGRLNAEVARAKAQEDAAVALSNKADADEKVKAESRIVAAQSRGEQERLQKELAIATRESEAETARAAAFRQTVGLKADQPPIELALNYVAPLLDKQRLDSTLLVDLANRIPADQYVDTVQRILESICTTSDNYGQVNWAIGQLAARFTDKDKLNRTALLVTDIALQNPLEVTHMAWLQGSCDLAGSAGNVYLQSRNAQILSRLQPQNPAYGALRSGEVFEKAGHGDSAEFQYKLAIKSAQTPEAKRSAILKLAHLYEDEGRHKEALQLLSEIVPLTVPGEEKAPPRR